MRRLYLRIYVAVLASILLSLALAALAWRLNSEDRYSPEPAFVQEIAGRLLPPATAPRDEQQQALERWRQLSGLDLALVAPDGAMIAAAGERGAMQLIGPGRIERQQLSLERVVEHGARMRDDQGGCGREISQHAIHAVERRAGHEAYVEIRHAAMLAARVARLWLRLLGAGDHRRRRSRCQLRTQHASQAIERRP